MGHFLPTAFVGYFVLPLRLLRYSVDMVCKVGFVTGSNAAEMAARGGSTPQCTRWGCMSTAIAMCCSRPLALGLTLRYGTELLRVWINPEFALRSGSIIPAIAPSAPRWESPRSSIPSSILYGLGKHQLYAYSLLVEGVLSTVALYVAIPRYGLAGAAWVTAVFMVVNRGLVTSWLFCRGVNRSFGVYLRDVYLGPTVSAIPIFLGVWWIKIHWLPGRNWTQVLAGLALVTAAYYLVAFFVCVNKEHQMIPWRWVKERLGGRQAV